MASKAAMKKAGKGKMGKGRSGKRGFEEMGARGRGKESTRTREIGGKHMNGFSDERRE